MNCSVKFLFFSDGCLFTRAISFYVHQTKKVLFFLILRFAALIYDGSFSIFYGILLLFDMSMKEFRPKKSLGQNFLHDANVVQKIIRAFHPLPTEQIIEIGPGKGALTSLLLQALPHLTAVELDTALAASLQEQFGEKLTILQQNILEVDLASLQTAQEKKIRLIGNIPYNITTPILFHVVESRAVVHDFVVMMQTEVAQRIIAKPRTKDYGILSIFLQYYCTPKVLFSVSRNSFFPIPQVSSTVLQLDFSQPFPVQAQNDQAFRTIVRGTFGKRRKTLRNGLRSLNIPPEAIEQVSLNLDQRPEELTVKNFITLADELQHYVYLYTP